MNYIKRLLAFGICFLMLFQIDVGLAAENVGAPDQQILKKDLDLLNVLGIFDDTFEDVDLDGEVSREEFAVTVARIFGNSADDNEQEPLSTFEDVQGRGAETVKALNLLTELGLISGTETGIFSPDDAVTQDDAIKILVSALGYTLPAQESGGYPTGYFVQANKIGLIRGVSINNSAPLDRGTFIRLLYQALFIDIMQPVFYGADIRYSVVPDETLLTNVMQINLLTNALVTANADTSLNGSQNIRRGYVEIGGQVFEDVNGLAYGYIGKTVNVYYKEQADGEKVIIYVEQTGNASDSLTISFEDIERIDGYTVYYYSETVGRRSHVTVAKDANMLFNGHAMAYNPELIDTKKGGKLVLDRSASMLGGYDLISVVQYTTMLVDAVDYENRIIYDRIVAGRTLELDKYLSEDRCDISRDGTEISLMDIMTGTVLTVYDVPDDSYISIAVVDKTVSGVIQSVDSENLIIDEVSYRYDKDLYELIQSHLGDSCTVFLDIDENVVWLDSVQSTGKKYGYLIQGDYQTFGFEKVIILRLITEDNNIEVYELNSKLQFNGERISGSEVERDVRNVLAPDGKWQQQLVQYETNKDGKIITLNTATFNPEPVSKQNKNNVFYCSRTKASGRYKTGIRGFSMSFSTNSATKVFIVSPNEGTEEDEFSVKSNSYFVNDSSYTVEAYNINEGGIADVVVCWNNITAVDVGVSSSLMMVDLIADGINSDGENVKVLCGLINGKYSEYTVKTDVSLEVPSGETKRSIKRGDVVRFALNDKNEICNISVDVNIDTQRTVNAGFGSVYTSVGWGFSGVVYSIDGNFAIVSKVVGEPLKSIDFTDVSNLYSTNIAGNIMIYDEELDEIYVGTVQDILPYKAVGESATRFFAKYRYDNMESMFIFKYKD